MLTIGGLATTSSVASSFSSPFAWLQRNTRTCALSALALSLRSLSVAEAPGAGTSTLTGDTCSDAAPAETGASARSAAASAAQFHFLMLAIPQWLERVREGRAQYVTVTVMVS